MATKLSTLYVGHCWHGSSTSSHWNPRLPVTPARLLRISCKMRHRTFCSQHRKQQAKKFSSKPPPVDAKLQTSDDEYNEVQSASTDVISNSTEATTSSSAKVDTSFTAKNTETDLDSSTLVDEKSLTDDGDSEEQLSNVRLEDLIGMIKNAEKDILLLNEARIHALENLENILSEKEDLRRKINILEMKLAETDARIKIAAQEKVHVEVLEDQLEKLKNMLTGRTATGESGHDAHEDRDKILNEVPLLHNDSFYSVGEVQSLSEEFCSLRNENMSLKEDIRELKAEFNNVMEAEERVLLLEKECSSLEAALKDLESKLVVAQTDVSELSYLQFDCMDLREKIGSLQGLLDKATKQADQAISALQENHELQKKVDRLEESLEEAQAYRLSSEKLQRYNELMQQKIILLEECLQRSDQEIHSNVELYQQSVKEFQDTLNSLKKESKRRARDGPVDDMPWEFWSQLLLIIDGWLLEKKISSNDAKLLREMAWNRDGRIRDAYLAFRDKNECEAVSMFLRLTYSPTRPGLHIIHIAAEMAPVAKVGGLGDVVAGLSKALQKKGHLVEIVLPKYDCIQYDRISDLRVLDVAVESNFDGQLFKNKVWVGTIEGLPVYFLEPHHPAKFFWRGQFYGEHDDFKRFSFFSRAALELLLQAGKKPDIIHCHDWQTAFVAPLYWDIYVNEGLDSARICFTCHNFEYQGIASASELASCGLDVHQLNRSDRMQDNSAHDRVNPVKGAIVFSNMVTTVSPTYAQEVRTAEGGHGLHATLNSQSRKFVGILNGIDTDTWDPRTDTFLTVQYGPGDLQGKAENKEALRKRLKLSSAEARQPLVGCITRLVPQKGVHLIRHAIYKTVELGGQFILLGSSPSSHIQREFENIADHFQNHPHARLILKYDEALSHAIYAASDMFIIPSIFEPCGLTQMIAMRYGSVPIVRKTGGLNDSVFDVDDDAVPLQIRNGFTFLTPDEQVSSSKRSYHLDVSKNRNEFLKILNGHPHSYFINIQGVNSALERAFEYYMKTSETWQQLVQKNMKTDFSWDLSASQYEELYVKSVTRARARTAHT